MKEDFKIDFIGIGAPKAGTTWLGHMLENHPQLCMSVPKEVHYFNDKLAYRNTLMEKNYSKGIGWYKMYFNHCPNHKVKGEITPRYSNDPFVPERIKNHNKDIKIIYCLRNPVDRIESHYNFCKYFVQNEDRSIQQAVTEETEFIEMSLYFRNLSRFLECFPKEQILLVWFDDIQKRPEVLIREVYTFLGVNPDFQPSNLHEKSNQARISQIKGLQEFIRKTQYKLIALGFSGLIGTIKRAGVGNLVGKLNSKPLQKDRVPPDLKQYIQDNVRADVLQLQAWSGRDLSHWLQ